MSRQSRRPLTFWAIAILILLAAWALRLHRLDFQDIWWDEARNIDVATRPLTQIANASELDIHPPLYFYGLHTWAQASTAVAFATRFISVWFGILTVALVYQLGQGLGRGKGRKTTAVLAMMVAAFAPYALAEAQETRMYTLSWAILAAGMLALWRALRHPATNLRRQVEGWGPFVLLIAMALLTHYATAFILAAWGLWLLAWALLGPDRWSRLKTLAVIGIAVLLLCLPVLPIALRQIPGYDNPNLMLPDLWHYLSQLYRAFIMGETVPESVWQYGRWLWAVLLGIGALLWMGKQARRRVVNQHWTLLLVWLLGGLAIFYLILVARSAFNPRYISFVLPTLWALCGWALAGWGRVWRPLPWLIAILLLALGIPSLRADLYDPTFFREDASGVVNYLEVQAGPDDIILVDQRYPLGLYLERWNNDFYGHPPDEPEDVAPAQYLFVDMTHDDGRRIDQRLTELAGDARKVFWVTWFESDMDPRGAVKALLNTGGERIDSQEFRGYRIQVWELSPPSRYQLASEFAPLDISIGADITLVEGDWSGRTAPQLPLGRTLATLRWQMHEPSARAIKVSVRLKDENGATLDQEDRLLINDLHYRSNAWTPGESALNVYSLHTPVIPGVYTLSVVVYDEETLEAIAVSEEGVSEMVIGTMTVGS